MNRQMLFLMALAFAMFVIAGVVLNRQLRRDAMLAARVRGVQRAVGIEAVIAPTDASQSGSCDWLPAWARRSPEAGLLSASTLEDLRDAAQHRRLSRTQRAGRVHRCQVAGPCRTAAAGLDRGCTNRHGRRRCASRRSPVRASSACCCPTTWCGRCTSAT